MSLCLYGVFSSGYFLGAWKWKADDSEHCRFHLHRWVRVNSFTPNHLWRWNRQSVPKRRLLIFRRLGNTHNKIYHHSHIPTCEDGTDRVSETSAFNIQTPGKYPEQNIPSFIHSHLWIWNGQSVPKRRLLIFMRRGNTQKKIHHIYNTAKFWELRLYAPFT
jgi:hypothetical protein